MKNSRTMCTVFCFVVCLAARSYCRAAVVVHFLCSSVQWHLCRCFGFSTRQSKLLQDLSLFHNIDLAIYREGISSLSVPDLQQVFLFDLYYFTVACVYCVSWFNSRH
jgi:hypothetical protein